MTALPAWCTLIRANNPSPMTLDGTNTYVLSTAGGNVVIDPGPLLDDHLEAVAATGDIAVVLLTHGHPDHAESVDRFHEMAGAPILARDPSLCRDGDPLTVDGGTIGMPGLEIRALHTPGHTSDSVCFEVIDGRAHAVLTGDTILGRGTTVVAYPDGQLGPYLDSLKRLRSLERVQLLPGHGPVGPDVGQAAEQYLRHRAERLEQVRAALDAGAETAMDVVEIVYADVDRALWPAAEASVRAQLDYLHVGHLDDG